MLARADVVINIPTQTYPAGTTTTPGFVVPPNTTGTFTIAIPCIPDATIVVRFLTADGKTTLARFRKPVVVCVVANLLGTWNVRPVQSGLPVHIEVTTDMPITQPITVTFQTIP
jgi:hypothetical protein